MFSFSLKKKNCKIGANFSPNPSYDPSYSGPPFLPMSDLWICGMTPPPAIVALMRLSNSSSPRMASCKWRGVIRFTFKSFEALPANSSTYNTNNKKKNGYNFGPPNRCSIKNKTVKTGANYIWPHTTKDCLVKQQQQQQKNIE